MKIYTGKINSPFEENKTIDFAKLTIDNEKIEIEFHSDQRGYQNVQSIFGIFNGFGRITLVHCLNIGTASGGGGNVVRYSADFLFQGVFINDFENHFFDRVSIVMSGLFDWIGKNSIINNLNGEKNTLKIEKIADQCIYSSEKISIAIFYTQRVKTLRENNQIILSENAGFRIISKNRDLSVWDFLDLIKEIKKLFFILSNRDTKIESTNFYSEKDDSSVCLFWDGNNSFGTPSQMSPSIDYGQIKNYLQSIINNWFENDDIQVSIELILEKTLNQNLSWVNHFLNSCFSIETYHRRFLNYKLFKPSKFKSIKEKIILSINEPEIKKLIEQNLAHINEPNFRNRLTDFESDFSSILPSAIEPKDYIAMIVKTRNYLVHRGSKKNVFSEFDMLYSAIYIETIVKINIFRIIGIEEEVIQKLLMQAGDRIYSFYNSNKEMQFDKK